MQTNPEHPESLEPMDSTLRRRWRLIVGMLLVCIGIGFLVGVLKPSHGHHHAQRGGNLLLAIQIVATLGIFAMVVPTLRMSRRLQQLGTEEQQRDLAQLRRDQRVAMVGAARHGEAYRGRPDLQRLAVRRELVRLRWSLAAAPLLALVTGLNAARFDGLVIEITGWLACALFLLSWGYTWRDRARLQGFLRVHP